MFLQKLDIQGFKSFANKTTFVFPQRTASLTGITAIVGPNGSGKSNVADAIRWVLGEQSMKLLRSKKSEDVIFFGSDTKIQLGFCEVTLFFNNEDHTLPLEYAEVSIARRLYRNGESDYLINGSKVRLADVILLLAQGNVGSRSYSVIGQGMIDLIVTMSPTERKYFFDEAAGVRQYQIKKDQAQHKLKATEDNIAQARILIAELEPKIKFFARQLKRLEEREVFEQELGVQLKNYYGAAWAELKERQGAHDAAMKEVQRQLDSALGEHERLMTEFQSYEQQASSGASEPVSGNQREYDECSQKVSGMAARLSLLDARIATGYEKRGEANMSFALQRKNELDAQCRATTNEHEHARAQGARHAAEEEVCARELEKIEHAIADAEKQFVAQAHSSATLSIDEIREQLKRLQEEKAYFFSDSRTPEEMREALSRLFSMLDELVFATEASRGNLAHGADAKTSLETLYKEKKSILARLQEHSVQKGIAFAAVTRLEKTRDTMHAEQNRIDRELAYFSSSDSGEHHASLIEEKERIAKERAHLEARITVLKKEIDASHAEQSLFAHRLLRIQNALSSSQKHIDDVRSRHTALSLEHAKSEAHRDEVFQKMCEELGCTDQEQAAMRDNDFDVARGGIRLAPQSAGSIAEFRRSADALKKKLEAIGSIDQEALAEYESTKERFEFLTGQASDLSASIESLGHGIAELDGIMKERFQASLAAIEKKFDGYFQQLFNGGRAHLVLMKASDVQREEQEGADEEIDPKELRDEIVGIDISAMPPGKKLKNMSVLSGGEKALTAIALICAIVSHNPSPFVILDEVDAALDESNAGRFASIVQELSQQTQFVVITHNRSTIHTAQCMYGVTMGEDGISRVLSLDIAAIDDTLNKITTTLPLTTKN